MKRAGEPGFKTIVIKDYRLNGTDMTTGAPPQGCQGWEIFLLSLQLPKAPPFSSFHLFASVTNRGKKKEMGRL